MVPQETVSGGMGRSRVRVSQSTDQMIATNMGRALYSSEVQQPERTTPALCDRGQAEQPGEAAAVLGRAHVLHPEGQPDVD